MVCSMDVNKKRGIIMPREVWDATLPSEKCVVVINGQGTEVDPDQPFGKTVKQLAGAAGLAKFTVIADGREIRTANMPDDFARLKKVEIKKYDEAA